MSAFTDLIVAAKESLPAYDGLTDQAWKVYRGFDRKEKLEKAIAAAEKEDNTALRLAGELADSVIASGLYGDPNSNFHIHKNSRIASLARKLQKELGG